MIGIPENLPKSRRLLEVEWARRELLGLLSSVAKLFSHLPISTLINGRTPVMHGGLFRGPAVAPKAEKTAAQPKVNGRDDGHFDMEDWYSSCTAKRRPYKEDLRNASKGGLEPDDDGGARGRGA